MLAVPYRAELRTQTLRGFAAIVLIVVAAVALYVIAGRINLNLDRVDAAVIAGGALVAAVFYSRRGERLGHRLRRNPVPTRGSAGNPPSAATRATARTDRCRR